MPLVGLEPGPFDPESSALTTGPLTPLYMSDLQAYRLSTLNMIIG